MTVPRSSRLALSFSLTLLLCGLFVLAQEPAATPPVESSPAEPATTTAETSDKPVRSKPADDDDRPARPKRVVKAPLAPAPAPTAAPKKPGFFERMFGGKKATPTPPPATPKPKPKVRKDDDDAAKTKGKKPDVDDTDGTKKAGSTPVPKASPTPRATPGPRVTPTPKASPAPKASPTPKGKHATPKEAPKLPTAADLSAEQKAVEDAEKSGDPEAIEKAKYAYARVRAQQDPHITELRDKAGAVTSEDDGRKALRAYNRALFDKMRKLEPAISERVDSMEKAVLQRLGGGDE